MTVEQALEQGRGHHRAGRLAEAEAIYRNVLERFPEHPEALHLLGALAAHVGNTAAAIALIGRAIAREPGRALYHSNLGESYRRAQQPDEAIACFQRAIALDPGMAVAHGNLGNLLWEQGRIDEAIVALERAIALDPGLAEAHTVLGNALGDKGRLDQALAVLERAVQLGPDSAEAYNNLGIVLRQKGRYDEAIAAFQRAVALKPDRAAFLNSLGVMLHERGREDEASAVLERAIALEPDYADAHNSLGITRLAQGLVEEAIRAHQRLLALRPSHHVAHSNLLMCMQYQPGATLAGLARAHAEWNERHAVPCFTSTSRGSWDGDRDPTRRLRLGFLSPDFRRHPVGLFLLRVFENLDRRALEVVCYSTRAERDAYTSRLEAAAHHWHEVVGIDDATLAEQIRADRIDILFDLSGHTGEGRLLVFARRPAPLQISWIGYVGTTGLSTMDYLIADRFHVPPGTEAHYVEKVLRMPDGYVCFEPPAEAPEVGPLPALTQQPGRLTFGSFNNLAKLGDDVIALWVRIVRRVPGSRLLLVSPALGGATARRRVVDAFVAAGGSAAQLDLRGAMTRPELLAAYNTVDLALDPFPYSGGVTTCEALWMGVPVITCPGETFAGRHTLSHLSNAGLIETVAPCLDDYVETAAALASDLPRLAAMRAGLRPRMARSPLCDGPRFARHLAALLRGVWQDWCREGPAA